MNIARGSGTGDQTAFYEVPDDELAVGSTLGGPKVATIIKANGAISKIFSVDLGQVLFDTITLRHYDARSGMYLSQQRPGTYTIHPEHQVHEYVMTNGVHVTETIFVLNGGGAAAGEVDPPGVYEMVELVNNSSEPQEILTYCYAVLRGETPHDVQVRYDKRLHAFAVWNKSHPDWVRLFGSSYAPESWESTLDYAQAVLERAPGRLSCTTKAPSDPFGVLQHRCRLEPHETAEFHYLASFGNGREAAERNYRACPPAREALERTTRYFGEILSRSVVLTPDPEVNRGVLWAKANMLRVQTHAPTGWCFTNDPTRSNNSVGRDTAWYAFGADYLTPDFARDSLLAYARLQEKKGMIVEYYNIITGETADYNLNINDNTPLIIMAWWHHYNATSNEDFLREIYPHALKAARYILSQRNEQGLVWCTADGTQDWGIIGWRNVIPNYRLSGATTEVNSECFAALTTVSHMARVLGHHEESAEFLQAADDLKTAINQHLYDQETGLYYLNIDIDGHARSNVTSDLVFPVMFGVADGRTAAHIIGRLSNADFWTPAGIHTVPRDAPEYTPEGGWGLLGGVWVGVSFWYASAAAKYAPDFMAHALSSSFRNYSTDPRRRNTVPGQFSEWLNGETLVNEGMMLSPWFPPRYLWAAVEGMTGFSISRDTICLEPRLAPEWKWMAVRNLVFRDQRLTWFVVRIPNLQIYTNFLSPGGSTAYVNYDEDISDEIETTGESVCSIALRHGENIVVFIGNTAERTVSSAVRFRDALQGAYHLHVFDSMINQWTNEAGLVAPKQLEEGLAIKLERKGFCVLELRQEV